MKRLFLLLLSFSLIGNCFADEPPSWDLLDEDCADISDWTDDDLSTGVSQVDPAGQFSFNTGASTAGYAWRTRDFGTTPNTFTTEIKTYHDAVGLRASDDSFHYDIHQNDETFTIRLASDGLFLYDTDSGYTEVGTDLVKQGGSAEWQTWRFLVTFTATPGQGTCDVYLSDSTHTNEKVGTAIPCGFVTTQTEGLTELVQYGELTTARLTHIDYIKIATGLYAPTVSAPTMRVIFIY